MVILKSLSTFLIMGLLGSSVATPAPVTQELVKRGRLLTGKYDSEAVVSTQLCCTAEMLSSPQHFFFSPEGEFIQDY